jgi:cold shock-like protein cspD
MILIIIIRIILIFVEKAKNRRPASKKTYLSRCNKPMMKNESRQNRTLSSLPMLSLKGCCMNSGTVKWFSDAKGYGFIIPDGQDREVFVHFRSIEMPGRKTLQTNQRVEFEFEQSERGLHATRVVPLPMKTEDAAS